MEAIKIISILLIFLSMLPLVFVLVKRRRLRLFMEKAISTSAEVTHCEKRYGLKGGAYYILSLQYKTRDGKLLQTIYIGSTKRETGDRIPIMYLPDNPEKCSIDFGRKMPIAIALTSLFFVLIVGVCIWLNHLY